MRCIDFAINKSFLLESCRPKVIHKQQKYSNGIIYIVDLLLTYRKINLFEIYYCRNQSTPVYMKLTRKFTLLAKSLV